MSGDDCLASLEQRLGHRGRSPLRLASKSGEILHEIGGRASVNTVAPQRDHSPHAAPRSVRQDFHLLVLVEHETSMHVPDGRRHDVGQLFTGECPMTDASLSWWQLLCRNLLQLQHAAHDENGGRECRDTALFSFGELDGVPVDLRASPHEIGERLWRWGFDARIHAKSVGDLTGFPGGCRK